jgi:hypothetical protein
VDGRLEDVAPCGAVVAVFDVVAELFARGVAECVAVRGEGEDGDGVGDGDSDGTGEGEGDELADIEGCGGIPITGASDCTPIRLLPMAAARIAPTRETGQPKPRSRRPRRPDWSTNTGAGAGSSRLDSNMSVRVWCADPRSMGVMTGRTLRGLSGQGT